MTNTLRTKIIQYVDLQLETYKDNIIYCVKGSLAEDIADIHELSTEAMKWLKFRNDMTGNNHAYDKNMMLEAVEWIMEMEANTPSV